MVLLGELLAAKSCPRQTRARFFIDVGSILGGRPWAFGAMMALFFARGHFLGVFCTAIIIVEKPCLLSPAIIFSPSGPAISAQYIRCPPQGCRACFVGCPCSASCRSLCPANCLCCQLLLPCQLPLPCQQSVFKGSFCFNGSWASIASSICVHRFGPWLPPAGAIDLQGQVGSTGSRVPTVPGVRW